MFICPQCKQTLTEYRYFVCPICKRRDPFGRLDKNCRKETGLTRFLGAPLSYKDEPVRKIIQAFKYQRVKALAEPLAEILIEFLSRNNFRKIAETLPVILAPVPLNNFKERERGFNQAAEIGKLIAQYCSLNFEEHLLLKTKNTSNQADIKNREERTKNVAGAFSLREPELAKGKIVILIDDVYTSGATMHECAKVLRKAEAKEVWGMTVAK